MDKLALVVAVARNGVIGKDGGLPWRIPEDLRHFKRVTVGHAVIMGRKTWDSIGRPLPDRRNIVVTRRPHELAVPAGVEVAGSFDEALSLARRTDDEPRVIGGAELYRLALPCATRVFLTEVDRDVEGDAFLPPFDRSAFREAERRAGEDPTVTYVTLERA
ncbi:MAG: dihydrofolate reductase [Deltaproteobacteria bacterium]|nr:dihydrofolate reductase [Deltaproteobacteria bacterium]